VRPRSERKIDPIFEGLARSRAVVALPDPPNYIKSCLTSLGIKPPATEEERSTFLEIVRQQKGVYERNQQRMTETVGPYGPID
jgi:hypothetical protein